ncbi:MerR family transcriptional regulator [Streptosporangium soli]|nr:MerR family transcriptional regulator [Streptosporangium sp. KLBMP 9127]
MYTIGQLAKISGLPVKTIRFYSDSGVLPERERTAAGYRLYQDEDRARLETIRTLREIGVDLRTIRDLGARELRDVLSLHLRTVEAQLKALQRTRAVLRATLDRGDPTDEDLRRLNALGRLGAREMVTLVDTFVHDVTGDNRARGRWLAGLSECMVPELPDEPTIEQLDAWLELTELLSDQDFRTGLRDQSADFWEHVDELDITAWQTSNRESTEQALTAHHGGIPPESPAAAPVLDVIMSTMAEGRGLRDGQDFRAAVRQSYEEHDPRAERYWELIAIIHGTPWPPEETFAHRWIAAALKCHDHPGT